MGRMSSMASITEVLVVRRKEPIWRHVANWVLDMSLRMEGEHLWLRLNHAGEAKVIVVREQERYSLLARCVGRPPSCFDTNLIKLADDLALLATAVACWVKVRCLSKLTPSHLMDLGLSVVDLLNR